MTAIERISDKLVSPDVFFRNPTVMQLIIIKQVPLQQRMSQSLFQ